jgi:hypothetical protein
MYEWSGGWHIFPVSVLRVTALVALEWDSLPCSACSGMGLIASLCVLCERRFGVLTQGIANVTTTLGGLCLDVLVRRDTSSANLHF